MGVTSRGLGLGIVYFGQDWPKGQSRPRPLAGVWGYKAGTWLENPYSPPHARG